MSQQKNGMSLFAFAEKTGIRIGQLLHYCRIGRIEGARFDRMLWQWRIHAPARLLTGTLAFDVGTRPHGLSAGRPRTVPATCRADGLLSLEDGFSARVGDFAAGINEAPACGHGGGKRPQGGTTEDALPAAACRPEVKP